jgi:hypothetical protein
LVSWEILHYSQGAEKESAFNMQNQPQKKAKSVSMEGVFCLASSRDLAIQIVDRVKTSGFSIGDISALFPEHESASDLAQEKSIHIHRRDETPVSQRAAWWTARRIGFASIGALAIPGVGSFVAAGPIILALGDALVGGSGGIASALVAMGVNEVEARHYEARIRDGRILISVHAENPADIPLTQTIFREAGAECVCTSDVASLGVGSVTDRAPGPSAIATGPFETPCGGTGT